jgi:hypothetical protein
LLLSSDAANKDIEGGVREARAAWASEDRYLTGSWAERMQILNKFIVVTASPLTGC